MPRVGTVCPAESTHCPVDATLALIGGKYKSLILWNLSGKTLRFSGLRREVPRATPKMLTQQLRELERDGLVKRTVYAVIPPKVEYELTELGESLRPVLESMYAWGSGYLRRRGQEPNCSMMPPGAPMDFSARDTSEGLAETAGRAERDAAACISPGTTPNTAPASRGQEANPVCTARGCSAMRPR